MRALLCDNGLRYDPAYPDPVPPSGEALIRVRLAGICNTDLELVRGYMGFRAFWAMSSWVRSCRRPIRPGLAGGWWATSMPPAAASM